MEMSNSDSSILKYTLSKFSGKFAVILDRDGTLNQDNGYTHKVSELKILDGVIENLNLLAKLGAQFFIASNQSGLARGFYSVQTMARFNCTLIKLLEAKSVKFCGVYICPHMPYDSVNVQFSCNCRKPKPGLIEHLISDFELDINKTIMIGNAESDLESARMALVKGFKIDRVRDWDKVLQYAKEYLC